MPLDSTDTPSIFYLHDSTNSSSCDLSTEPRKHWSVHDKMLKMFTALKMFREYTNQKHATSLTILLIVDTLFMPLVFSEAYYQKNNFVASTFYGAAAYYNFFWIFTYIFDQFFLMNGIRRWVRI